jgi:hypothetical protein
MKHCIVCKQSVTSFENEAYLHIHLNNHTKQELEDAFELYLNSIYNENLHIINNIVEV